MKTLGPRGDDFHNRIRRAFRLGMTDAPLISLRMTSGFEIGNFTPYECYETWCTVWYAEDALGVVKKKARTHTAALEAVVAELESPSAITIQRARKLYDKGELPSYYPESWFEALEGTP